MPKPEKNLTGFPEKFKQILISPPKIFPGQMLPFSIRYRITGGFYPSNTLLAINQDGSARYFGKSHSPSNPPPDEYVVKTAQLSKDIIAKLNGLLREHPPSRLQDSYGEFQCCDFPFRGIMFLSDRYDKTVKINGPIEFQNGEGPDWQCLLKLLELFAEIFDTYFRE